jgi:MFS family permease
MNELLESVGAFGRYQKLALLIVGLSSFISSGLVYSIIFVTATPDLRCSKQPIIKNSSNSSYGIGTCSMWSNKSFECKFDKKYYGQTVVTDLELICDKKFYASISQTLLFLGQFSSAILGYLSDRFGRKWALLLSTRSAVVVLLVCSLANLSFFNLSLGARFIIFCIAQYFIGIISSGLFSITFFIAVEVTTEKYKTLVTNINMYMFVVGEFIVMIVFYFSRDWKATYYFLAAYCLIISILVQFLLFESPMFLLKSKKYKETYDLLKRIAKKNGKCKEIETAQIADINLNEEFCLSELKKMSSSGEETDLQYKKNNPEEGLIAYVFKSRKNVFTILALIYIWISILLVFFGISLG